MDKNVKIFTIVVFFIVAAVSIFYFATLPDYIYEDDPVWLQQLEKHEGLSEIEGPGNNQWIIESYRLCNINNELWDDNKTSWCSSGLCKIMYEVQVKGTADARAESWKTWGAPVRARKGAVCVFRQGDGYHVTVMVDGKEVVLGGVKYYACIGCNQSDRIRVSYYKMDNLVAMRWPTESERKEE